MSASLGAIVLTALLTSAFTLGAAWLVFQRHLKARLEEAIEAKAAELSAVLEARVRDGVRRGIRDGLVDLPSDVMRKTRRGITETGAGLLGDGINTILGTPGRRRDK